MVSGLRAGQPIGLLMAAALTVAACGGDGADTGDRGAGGTGGTGGTGPTATATPPPTDAGKAARAKAAVFQAGDFPAGFEAQPEEEGLDLDLVWGDLVRCLGVQDAAPNQGGATSATFLRRLATQAESTVQYTTQEGAGAVAAAMTGPRFDGCARDAFAADLKRNAPEGATPGRVEVASRNFPQKGQQTLAWRINATMNLAELQVPLFQDFIVVLDDDALIRFLFLNPGSEFPQELEQSLVDKVIGRA